MSRPIVAIASIIASQDFERVMAGEWDESQHPRDEHGRFAEGGGSDTRGGSAPAFPGLPAHHLDIGRAGTSAERTIAANLPKMRQAKDDRSLWRGKFGSMNDAANAMRKGGWTLEHRADFNGGRPTFTHKDHPNFGIEIGYEAQREGLGRGGAIAVDTFRLRRLT